MVEEREECSAERDARMALFAEFVPFQFVHYISSHHGQETVVVACRQAFQDLGNSEKVIFKFCSVSSENHKLGIEKFLSYIPTRV